MAKNLTTRALNMTVRVNDNESNYTVFNKESAYRKLYSIAIDNWNDDVYGDLPPNRFDVIGEFFGRAGNDYEFRNTTVVPNEVALRSSVQARTRARRQFAVAR